MDKRVNTVAKLGYKMCIVPVSSKLWFNGMKIIGCKNLKEVINTVFTAMNQH
uniref:Uncharacterized protein n=1 Tax=Rhizophora mucronata TaxID=61149 RepID=A0A2P2JNM1_RHIMU